MMVPGGLHPGHAVNFIPDQYRPPLRMHAAPRAPAPAPQPQVNYTVAYNVSAHRTLCKNCRNPIASNSLKIGYRDRPQQMRWYHLGCLPADAWQQASLPGRLEGLPDLPPAQWVRHVQSTLHLLLMHRSTVCLLCDHICASGNVHVDVPCFAQM